MRWVPLALLVYAITLLQVTIGNVLTLELPLGQVRPDFAAMAAVFFVISARTTTDGMLAAWALGLGLDLTAGGGAGQPAVVGPMSAGFALAAGLIMQVREALFSQRRLAQAAIAFAFCIMAHGVWITAQSVVAYGHSTSGGYGRLWMQVLALATYTAVGAPLACGGLSRVQKWFIAPQVGRSMRR